MDPHRQELALEVERRRTFAIISRPDAGKMTLTEKLLLFGGAIREAGAARAQKASRHATSDWLELEKQRGISVSSSVMHFEHEGYRVNILDTPAPPRSGSLLDGRLGDRPLPKTQLQWPILE